MDSMSVENNILTLPSHLDWLRQHGFELGEFAKNSKVSHGFAWLDEEGRPDTTRPLELWINCRMTHCFALLELEGQAGYGELIDHGIKNISTNFKDPEHPGYFSAITQRGEIFDDTKAAYAHAFVVLAASSALAAKREGAKELLTDALSVLDTHFYEAEQQMHSDSWDRAFSVNEPYRGINANMHCVEALLAASAVLEEPTLLQRAVQIIKRALDEFARGANWALPEHFDTNWQPLYEYNRSDPAHPFRPYGATIGHWFEWARLALQAKSGLAHFDLAVPDFLSETAFSLLNTAIKLFGADGNPGFVYTTDFNFQPVVRERMHWVITEALAAGAIAYQENGDLTWANEYAKYFNYAKEYFIDSELGSWRHELDQENRPASTVWPGKPDIYHAYQAVLTPRLPIWPPFAAALAQRQG